MNEKKFTHEKFMSLAIDEAKKAKDSGDWPFGCVIVKDGLLAGVGRVTEKTGGDITDHAEIRAIRNACKNLSTNNLSGCIIYCTNEPCLMCASAIFQANIATVVISVSRHDLPHLLRPRNIRIDDLVADLNFEVEIIRDVRKDETLDLFGDISK